MKIGAKLISYALAAMTIASIAVGASAQDKISTVVGNGPDGIPALNANLYYPQELATDSAGNIYVAVYDEHKVFKFAPGGTITLIAGNGFAGYSGDGGKATAANLNYPQGIAVDGANPANVYIADTANCLVRKVTASTGIITTVAGLVTVPATGAPYSTCGYTGDNGQAKAAELNHPTGVAFDAVANALYIADYNNGRIRRVSGGNPTGTITTVAGGAGSTTATNNCAGSSPYGDGGAANAAYLCYPAAVTVDNSVNPANLFISEYSARCDIQEVVGSSKKIYQVAGNYTCGFKDGVTPATTGQFNGPYQMAVKVSGATTTVAVADFSNNRVRQFTLTYAAGVPKPGELVTVAGTGGGYSGDGGPALSAGVNGPAGIIFDPSGNIYVAGQYDLRVRKVLKSTGYISTVAGWGQYYYSNPVGVSNDPGGGPSLYQPYDVFADPASTNLYIGGYSTQADYVWDSSTTNISTLAGNGVAGYAGDGTSAHGSGTELNYPLGVVKDTVGNVYIADWNNCVIRRISAGGTIHTFVGGTDNHQLGCGFNGDGAGATTQINRAHGMAIDSANNLYFADYYNCLVRKVTGGGTVTTVAGLITTTGAVKSAGHCGSSIDGGSALASMLYNPTDVKLDGAGNIYIDDYNTSRIRKVDVLTKTISTVAGDGVAGYTGDGLAAENSLYDPQRISVDKNGNLFISDYYNNILRWVDPGGQMTTFAGTPRTAGFSGDGGVATSALLYYPVGITEDPSGNFYFADYQDARIRKVTAFAGYGRSTSSLSFGNQATGTVSEYQSIYLSAIGPVTINSITMPAGFSEIDDCAGFSMATGETCEIDVSFTPTKTGSVEGSMSIASNAFFPNQGKTVLLSGRGIGLVLSGSLAFGAEPLKTPLAKTVTLTNTGAAVTLSKIYLTKGAPYSITGGSCPVAGGPLASGASCTITVTFNPTVVGAATTTLVIASNDPSSPLLAGATGTGTEVKLSTATLAFGNAFFRNPTTLTVTVSNVGTASFTVSPAISGSGASSFTASGCTTAVAGGGNCVLTVKFNPAAVAAYAATLTLTTTGGSNPAIALTGTGVAADSVTPTSIAFKTIAHGTNEITNVTVKNLGPTATLTISTAFSGTGTAAYSISATGNTCTGAIAAGASCTLPVKFAPPAAASYPATLTITTNGGTNPAVTLTGTGS